MKDPKDTNALAVVDRKIQQIKTAISERMIEEGANTDWRTILPDIVKALNETPTEALHGHAPDDIDAVAASDLQKANAAKAEQNQAKQLEQKKKIAESGTVRMRLTRIQEEEKKRGRRGSSGREGASSWPRTKGGRCSPSVTRRATLSSSLGKGKTRTAV